MHGHQSTSVDTHFGLILNGQPELLSLDVCPAILIKSAWSKRVHSIAFTSFLGHHQSAAMGHTAKWV